MKIKMNREKMEEAVRDTVCQAGRWARPRHHSGELQLYARFDTETGVVEEFFIEAEAGHNTWHEGDNIIHVHTEKWFDPMEHELLSEWLKGEFEENEGLKRDFIEYLKEEDIEHDQPHEEFNEFEIWNPEKWEELMDKWAEIALEYHINEYIQWDHIVQALEEGGVVFTD